MRSSTIRHAAPETGRRAAARSVEQAQVEQLRERLTPVVEHAVQLAREQAAHAALAAGHARDWAGPRVGAAVERGRLAAAPHVGAAAGRVVPAVDAARDRIVEDLLPRVIEAVHHATLAGAAAKAAAAETVSRTVEDAALSVAAATPSAKARARRRRRRIRTLWATLAAAVLSAVATAVVQRARSRQATWELAPTEAPTRPGSDTSAMDVIASAAGPSDAGVARTPQTPAADLGSPAEPLEQAAPLTSAPSTGVNAEQTSDQTHRAV